MCACRKFETSRDLSKGHNFSMTRPATWALLPALIDVLAAHGLDCFVVATPKLAMLCCNAVRCPSRDHHSHGSQDCCNPASQLRAVLGRTPPWTGSVFRPWLRMCGRSLLLLAPNLLQHRCETLSLSAIIVLHTDSAFGYLV